MAQIELFNLTHRTPNQNHWRGYHEMNPELLKDWYPIAPYMKEGWSRVITMGINITE